MIEGDRRRDHRVYGSFQRGLPRSFTLRHTMIVVACLAIFMAAIRLLRIEWLRLEERTYQGPLSGLLKPGQHVLLVTGFRAMDFESLEVIPWISPPGDVAVVRGTSCRVLHDQAWDEDSCYPDRAIAVEVLDGENRGRRVYVPRRILRRRR